MNRNIDYIIDEDSATLELSNSTPKTLLRAESVRDQKNAKKYPCKWGTLLYASGTFQGRPPAGAYHETKNSEKIPPTTCR